MNGIAETLSKHIFFLIMFTKMLSTVEFIIILNTIREYYGEFPGILGGFPGSRENEGIPVKNCRGSSQGMGDENGEYSGNSPIFGKSGNSPAKSRSRGMGNMQRRIFVLSGNKNTVK